MADLSDRAREALERARRKKLSYAVRVLHAPDGRPVVILGEAHLKLAKAEALGRAVVEAFELRGVETFQRDGVFCGRALGILIQAPRLLLRLLSLGAVRGSTITEAKQLPSGHTVELERTKHVPFGLHVASCYLAAFFLVAFTALLLPILVVVAPTVGEIVLLVSLAFQRHMLLLVPAVLLRRYRWSWMVHPLIGILTLRDELMAAGAARMLADYRDEEAAVLVMGRAHVQGCSRLLIERYGFSG